MFTSQEFITAPNFTVDVRLLAINFNLKSFLFAIVSGRRQIFREQALAGIKLWMRENLISVRGV